MCAPRSCLFLLLLLAAPLLFVACRPRAAATDPLPAKTLSPEEFQVLNDEEKIHYRSIPLRIPEAWGGSLLPFSRGPYPNVLEKAVESGDVGALMAQYNRALFELEHPRVRVDFVNFDMWSPNFKSALAVALASHRAPAVYVARDLPQTIDQGMYADITDLLQHWDQANRQPEASVHEGTVAGRTYTIAGNELAATVIRYRKDWFREAGIVNEHGEPGPPANWTWDDFRRIAQRLTDPAKRRYGFAGETRDFFYNDAHGIRLYIPDRTGRRTWRFNDQDPRVIESLAAARRLVREDKAANTSVSMGWFEWHSEFDASRAAMIQSFAAHIPRESLEEKDKMGPGKPFAETVGMTPPPSGPTGLNAFQAITNPFGFDPTLNPEELQAAFDWTKSLFYGPIFVNNLRTEFQRDRALGKRSSAYATLLTTPYEPDEQVTNVPLSSVFPPDYLRMYDGIRAAPAVPLARQFGLREPPTQELDDAVKAMYSEAILSANPDLKALVARTARLVNTTMLDFRTPDDRARLKQFYAALGLFYARHFPRFYREEWPGLYERYYRVE